MVLRLAGLVMVVAASALEAQLVPTKKPVTPAGETPKPPGAAKAPTMQPPTKAAVGQGLPAAAKAASQGKARGVAATVPETLGWFGFRTNNEVPPLVMEVAPGSPAERGGMRTGDRILGSDKLAQTVNEPVRVRDSQGVTRTMMRLTAGPVMGRTYALNVLRGADTLMLSLVAAAPPSAQVPLLVPTRSTVIDADTVEAEARAYRGELARTTLQPSRAPTRSVAPLARSAGLPSGIAPISRSEFPNVSSQDLHDHLVRVSTNLNMALSLRETAISGAEFEQLNPALGQYFGGVSEGVFVLRVGAESPAASAGLQPGDIVQSVNGVSVATVQAIRDAVTAEAGAIAVRVIRKGKQATVTLRKE